MNILELKCGGEGVLQILKYVLTILNIIYILIPIFLILLITVDFVRATMSKEDEMKKYLNLAIKRILFTIALFLVKPIALFAQDVLGDLGVNFTECLEIAEKTSDFSDYRANVQIDTSMVQAGTKNYDTRKYIPSSEIPAKDSSITVDKFIASLEKISNQIESDGNWVYRNSGIKGTLEKERNDDRGVSCAKMVSWALYDIGVYTSGSQGFWKCFQNCSNTNKVRWRIKTQAAIEPYLKFVQFSNSENKTESLLKNNKLKKGDIILWYDHQHTSVYAGNGLWYDAGCRGGSHGYYSNGIYHFKTLETQSIAYPRIWGVYRWK